MFLLFFIRYYLYQSTETNRAIKTEYKKKSGLFLSSDLY